MHHQIENLYLDQCVHPITFKTKLKQTHKNKYTK